MPKSQLQHLFQLQVSALAGIYYSLEANGASTVSFNKDSAQEELKALSDINAENKDKSGAMMPISLMRLWQISRQESQRLKKPKEIWIEEDVRKSLDTLKNYKLDQAITGNQVNIIINFALNLSKSTFVNADFTKTLNDLKQSIVS